jgi:hypothetical protein
MYSELPRKYNAAEHDHTDSKQWMSSPCDRDIVVIVMVMGDLSSATVTGCPHGAVRTLFGRAVLAREELRSCRVDGVVVFKVLPQP